MKNKEVVFSAVQPSGKLTIGNYIGSIRNWINIQDTFKCIYCIADLHTLTSINKSNKIYKLVLDTLAIYLACGINPKKSIIFAQSYIPEHNQLYWILNCFVYYNELIRMNQFKKQLIKYKNKINLGILNYPILMASDILLYKADNIPVGKDQKQHIELVRNVARRFNNLYGDVFKIPRPYIVKIGSKIMSLLNPNVKMSKSDKKKNSFISLLDDYNTISIKLKYAVTDSDNPPKIIYDPIRKPGISNLLSIFSGFTGNSIKEIETYFNGKNYNFFKSIILEVIHKKLSEIQEKYKILRKNENKLRYILNSGAVKANKIAKVTLSEVYNKINIR